MKKLIAVLLVLALISPVVLAAEQKGMEQTSTTQEKVQSTNELRQLIQERQQQMYQEMANLGEQEKGVYQNQNKVRLAVHALLAMEDLAGNVGPQIAQVAREFDNSVQATIKAEEKVQKRSGFARFFAGGDKDSAEDIEAQVVKNKQRIQQLNQLRSQCSNEDVKNIIREQIASMESEQTRLQNLAQKEKESKGLFGWIWK